MSVLNVDEALATHFAKAPKNETDGFMAADIKKKHCSDIHGLCEFVS